MAFETWNESGPDPRLGLDLYFLWLTSSHWIKRRVETAELLGPSSLRRRVSVDLIAPNQHDGKSLIVVPLALLKKQPLLSFDVVDESGAAISVLTRQENGHAAWSMLSAAAGLEIANVKGSQDIEKPEEHLMLDLRTIAFAAAESAAEIIGGFEANSSTEQRRILTGNAEFMALARTLSEHFLLLTLLEKPGRRVLKFTYSERMERVGSGSDKGIESLGWRPARFEFAIPAIGESESFHFELSAPKGLEVVEAKLVEEIGTDRRELPGTKAGNVAHLYTSVTSPAADGTAAVWLGIARSGLVRSGFLLSCFTVVILTLFALAGLSSTSADPAGALLLTVPALVATLIVRPGEHGLVSDLLLGVRIVIAATGAIGYLAAFVLATGIEYPLLGWLWSLMLVLGCGCAGSLLRAMVPLAPKPMRS